MNFEEYRFYLFSDADLAGIFSGNAAVYVKLGKDPETAYAEDGREIEAACLGIRRHDADTYLLYAYRYKNREYGFLWETFFDEADRAKSGGEPHVWYDDVAEGAQFRVRISMKDPKQHVALDVPFTGMNDGQVLTLGDRDLSDKEGAK